ncbi:MAG: tryptophan--tRNA ligase [Euzebyales bacterium]|nr:tryptophan--tRNA ligase [Euzebyales bacterium]MDQ3326768.1 tryptophan--tRNA ligase [Actinomycetota bacterium]
MHRVLSGIQPSGDPHIGNYLGAWLRWVGEQVPGHFFCIVDQHAITVPYDPADLRQRTVDLATWLLAAGLDPEVCTLFVQSQVREHTELAWILNCVATMGELARMTQFKEKSEGRDSVSVGLFDYPVLQAADILLYQAEQVPIGADQRQHVELTRDLAARFNHRFGDTFTLPQPTFPTVGARVMDLQLVDKKMSKSLGPAGTLLLNDEEATTRKKLMRAVTDSGSEVRAERDKPGVTNLLDLFAAVTGATVPELEDRYSGKGYGDFKGDLAEAVNGVLRPLRERHAELSEDPEAVTDILRLGATRAREVATTTMQTVRERLGFLR